MSFHGLKVGSHKESAVYSAAQETHQTGKHSPQPACISSYQDTKAHLLRSLKMHWW